MICIYFYLTVKACLKAHNERRALHGASPLVWDDTLVEHAQVWADHLAATGKIHHDPNRNEKKGTRQRYLNVPTKYYLTAIISLINKSRQLLEGSSSRKGIFSQLTQTK